MIRHLLNKSVNGILFVLVAFIIECISFAFMYNNPFSTYVFLDLIVFIILTVPIYFVKTRKFDIVYFSLLTLFLVILLIVNTNYYLVLGDIFSLQYLSYVGEGMSVINADFINFFHLVTLFLIWIVFVLGLIYINVKVNKEKPLQLSYHFASSLIGTILLIISTASYFISFSGVVTYERNEKDNYLIDLITLSKPQNFNDLGMLSYYAKESDYLYGNNNSSGLEIKEMANYLTSKVDSTSKYSGLLKDYNVVTIMIETGTSYMVNEQLTPNLYSMMQEGLNFENNYFKNKTNVSEYIGIVGNYPTSGLTGNKQEYVLPFTLPNMLSDYNTMYFHDVGSKRDIYSRKKLMPTLGFDKSYFHEDLLPDVPEWNWGGDYPLDSETIEPVLDYMLKDISKPIYAFYTSLSMHGPYVNPINRSKLASMYYKKLSKAIADEKWENPLQGTENERCIENFMLACMDFDVALGKMIDAFKEKGIYDNTLFVLYGDHDLYYDGADDKQLSFSLTSQDDITNYKLYDTVLLFYNKKLNEIYNNDSSNKCTKYFVTPHIVVPTILDLLGVKYNANLYMNDSVFSKNYTSNEIFYSYELSCFFNDKYLTSNGLEIEKVFDEKATTSQIFLQKVNEYVEKQTYVDKVYKSNLFKDYKYEDFCY